MEVLIMRTSTNHFDNALRYKVMHKNNSMRDPGGKSTLSCQKS